MIKGILENINFTAINIGSFDQLNDHEFLHPRLKHLVKGKLFVGELLKSTGAEVSFNELKPQTTISFLHQHKKHEEIYLFLKGFGKYQVDDDVFDITEGSIVRVAPEGKRTIRNDSEQPMIYIVIQSQADTLAGYDVSDGYRSEGEIKI